MPHECPGGCGRRVPHTLLACKGCWHRLPKAIRTAITHRRNDHHRTAIHQAHTWYAEHPLSTRDDK